MSRTAGSHRLITAVAATTAALALIAGCGGTRVAQSGGESATQDSASAAASAAPTASSAPAASAASTEAGATTATAAKASKTKKAAPSAAPASTPLPLIVSGPATPAIPAAAKVPNAGEAPKTGAAPKAAVAPKAGEAGKSALAAVTAAVASAPIFGGSGSCRPATLSPVNIGNVSTLSGVLGQLFAPVVPALKTFVTAQNACGGLNGHPIKFFVEDDQGDPATAVSKVDDEIKNDHVLAFVGDIQVLTIDAVVSTIKRAGIPIIGSDLTSNTWFTNPLLFPQGAPPQSISYGYTVAANEYFKKQKVGDLWCLEVPAACQQIDTAFAELAPKQGLNLVKSVQASMTSPSYTTQCLELKNAGVELLALTTDAASQNRLVKSCDQVGFRPDFVSYPLGVGNESLFFGNPDLGNTYVPLNTFPWMASSTPAEKFFQASVKKYDPGFATGDAASLGWTAGALLVAAGSNLSAENPTTQQLLDALYTFKGQSFTRLGGLTVPLTFREGSTPKVPYCLFAAISNKANNGWESSISTPRCTDVVAPSDPQSKS